MITLDMVALEMGQNGRNKNNNREINFPMAPKQIKFATLLYLLNKHPYLSIHYMNTNNLINIRLFHRE